MDKKKLISKILKIVTTIISFFFGYLLFSKKCEIYVAVPILAIGFIVFIIADILSRQYDTQKNLISNKVLYIRITLTIAVVIFVLIVLLIKSNQGQF